MRRGVAATAVLCSAVSAGVAVGRDAPLSPTLLGPAVTVWNASFSTCGARAHDNVDAPARAFIDAAGVVHLTASCRTSRLLSGPTLFSARHDCSVVLASANESSPTLFADNEWISSTYSLGTCHHIIILYSCHGPGWVRAITSYLSARVRAITSYHCALRRALQWM